MVEPLSKETRPHEGACTCPACAHDLWASGIKGGRVPADVAIDQRVTVSSNPTDVCAWDDCANLAIAKDNYRRMQAELERLQRELGRLIEANRLAAQGRREFRQAMREARDLCARFAKAWEDGGENMDRLCEINRNLGLGAADGPAAMPTEETKP